MPTNDQRKRELRVRIGRLRRRIDRRARATRDDAARAVSWRTYAAKYPGNLLLGALGLGLALSAGLSARRLAPWIGRRLLGRSLRQARRHAWKEAERLWRDATPPVGSATETSSTENGGADER